MVGLFQSLLVKKFLCYGYFKSNNSLNSVVNVSDQNYKLDLKAPYLPVPCSGFGGGRWRGAGRGAESAIRKGALWTCPSPTGFSPCPPSISIPVVSEPAGTGAGVQQRRGGHS